MASLEISPKYIIVVGAGGCGKTQAAEFLQQEWTQKTKRKTIITEEPSRQNRNAIFALANTEGVPAMDVVRAFYNDRVSVINGTVKPNLEDGNNVVSIRGYPCTHAYEGPLGATHEEMYAEHLQRFGPWGADYIYYLRLSDPIIGLKRKGAKLDGDPFDESKKHEYHLAVIAEYDRMAERYNFTNRFSDPIFGRWITIDADRNIPKVQEQLEKTTEEVIRLLH